MIDQSWDINRIIDEYADTVTRICYSYGKNYHDMQDIFQTVFLKFMKVSPSFDSKEHEKAWIIRVTINACKDFLKLPFHRNQPMEDARFLAHPEKEDFSYVREAVRQLPDKYRDVIYLFYFEEYQATEIAEILGKKENTIYTRLDRGRQLLEKTLGGEHG